MKIKVFIKQHPVLIYYVLTFAISWGGGLVVFGPGGFVGITQPSQAQFLFAIWQASQARARLASC